MKAIIVILILAVATCAPAKKDNIVTDTALFVNGFLRGALVEEIARVDDCLNDGDAIVASIGRIIMDVEKGFDLVPLIADLGDLFTNIPKSLKECKDLPPTVAETFTGWSKKLINPIEMGKIVAIALNKYKGQLEGDATGFVDDWKNGKFEESGLKLGDIPHVLFDLCAIDMESLSVTPFDVGYFLDGFLSKALQSDIQGVESCLTDADDVLEDIEKFVTDIEGGFDLLNIITDLGALFTHIPTSVRDCSDFGEEVEKVLGNWENTIKDPITIAKIVYISLSKYADRLKTDATGFVSEWKAEDYQKSGELLGDIPHVLFDLAPAKSPKKNVFKSIMSEFKAKFGN
ncbi:unnamed protein product [Moneuplotes crassus]|uniref:Uncharacterized protein n=1 Tax=Euplotes crassus TaxID=5936 RepID=A0AAD2CYP5_EUPCR|nr:unnamed protein product [Moneuplotes crassus]